MFNSRDKSNVSVYLFKEFSRTDCFQVFICYVTGNNLSIWWKSHGHAQSIVSSVYSCKENKLHNTWLLLPLINNLIRTAPQQIEPPTTFGLWTLVNAKSHLSHSQNNLSQTSGQHVCHTLKNKILRKQTTRTKCNTTSSNRGAN